eukprot:scaffold2657_cov368-Pavlova_lutheri.AAC.9
MADAKAEPTKPRKAMEARTRRVVGGRRPGHLEHRTAVGDGGVESRRTLQLGRMGHQDGRPSGMARSIGWTACEEEEPCYLGTNDEVRKMGLHWSRRERHEEQWIKTAGECGTNGAVCRLTQDHWDVAHQARHRSRPYPPGTVVTLMLSRLNCLADSTSGAFVLRKVCNHIPDGCHLSTNTVTAFDWELATCGLAADVTIIPKLGRPYCQLVYLKQGKMKESGMAFTVFSHEEVFPNKVHRSRVH